ncbi:leucine-rich repeat domain-containing protein [Mangrovimonas yunxiaonensis]|uniref:leucine-rich repeat domain-containing protein n=1 Tax=Mangrovimonas yunxiaonensis TaxID=1197477 RepID=UPI00068E2983|nr:hypothetical protein [Mangrovimonas yunxiaonensis]GGH35198.1 hypothetical protein GCM10011364_01550 [Mangrovimonas yunxiaonensis]
MKPLKTIFFFLLIALNFNNCSSDDSSSDQEVTRDGGTVYTSEIVRIKHENLNQEYYQGTFNGSSIELINVSEGELAFLVPSSSTAINETNLLEINSLNLKINYKVKQTSLSVSPEETIEPFITNLNTTDTSGFDQGEKVQEFIDSFNAYYASLTNSEKQSIAEFYFINKDLLNGSLSSNRTAITSDALPSFSKCQEAKFKTAILGGIAALTANPTTMPISIFAAAGAVVSFKNAVENCSNFLTSKIKHVFMKLDNFVSSKQASSTKSHLSENRNSPILFTSGVSKDFTITNNMRSLKASDNNDDNELINNFFSYVATINNFILNSLNNVINSYNNYAPSLFQLDPFNTPITIPQNSTTENIITTNDIYNNITFSITNSDVTINSLNFNNGNLSLKLLLNDPNIVETVATLNYSYADDFNEKTGYFNIKITNLNDFDIFTDAAVVKEIYVSNNFLPQYHNDPRWNSQNESEVIELLEEILGVVVNDDGRVSVISFQGDSFSTIPYSIGYLSELTHLSFRYTNITTIPSSIGYLSNLSILNLGHNYISSVPEEIGNLTSLTEFSMNSNMIYDIPSSIGNLTNLIKLNFDNNNLSTIPSEIGYLNNLTDLTLTQNPLTSIPVEIGNLSNLEVFNIYNNTTLLCLPQEVWDMVENIEDFNLPPNVTGWGDTDCSN